MLEVKFKINRKGQDDRKEKVTMSFTFDEIENPLDHCLLENIIEWSADFLQNLNDKIGNWNDVLSEPILTHQPHSST